MATVENFEDVISCAICLDVLDDPKVLPCSHVFCRKCLQALVTRVDNDFDDDDDDDSEDEDHGDKIISCPECRKVHPVPGGNASHLVTDLRIKKLIETCLCADCGEFDKFCKPCEKCGVKSCEVCICGHTDGEKCVLLEKLRELTDKLPNQCQKRALDRIELNWANFRKKNAEQKKESDRIITKMINLLQEKRCEVLKVYDDYEQYARDRITNIQQMKQIKNSVQRIRSQINDLNLNAVKESLSSFTKYDEIVSKKNAVLSEVIPDPLGEVDEVLFEREIKHFASPITRRQAGKDEDVELLFSTDARNVYQHDSTTSDSCKLLAEGNVRIYRHRGGLYQLQVQDKKAKIRILKNFDWNNGSPSTHIPTLETVQSTRVEWILNSSGRRVQYSTLVHNDDRRCELCYLMRYAVLEGRCCLRPR